ncbi:MAG: prepilin peptidase [Candidatus Taylorbacteria bacterium]|nr:prepilin peptidase [Candidatus Taylorbacteria bacterium]
MDHFIFASIFVFGAIIGSFLNVVVLRFDTGASISRGRSKCFSCGKTLSWYELVPIFSFLFQGGRCKGCRSKISWQYPAIEISGGLAALAAYLWALPGQGALSVASFALLAALLFLYIAITAYDLRHKIIPDEFSYGAAAVALALLGVEWAATGTLDFGRLAAGPALFAFFGFFWLVSKGTWMGLGDAKLALSIGWALGLSAGVASVLLSFWTGAAFAFAAMAIQKIRSRRGLGLKSEIPFGPFMIVGFLLSLLFRIDIQAILSFLAV